ncbi:MAG: uncharacterized protein KVP18_001513 [Porospora cf. gigantea A]|uniref:uncharacterized protein n=1 Tax=Porospora cf. gigantea A TaxID=2853593 RepID=UPI00355A08DA|nr:MAG: hypothetical protein KVP18_001513 [Porospora cf. gigantea A]
MCNILEKADVGAVLTTAWYKGIRRFIRSRDVRWDRLEWTALSSEEDEGDLPPCHVSPEDLAFLQFTSGSTSMPKGVMITHGSLLQNSHLCLSVFGLECTTPSGHVTLDDAPLETMLQRMQIMQTEWEVSKGHRGRGFSWLPFYHDMGLVGFVVTPLIFGGTAYMMSPVDFIKFPESWLQGLSMFKAQLTAGPNFAFELVCRKIRPEKLASLDLSEVSGILCGAEPIIPKVMHEFLKVFAACGLHSKAIRPAFGLAENTLIVTGSPRRDFPIVSLAINPESLDTGEVDVLLEWPLTSKQSVQSEGMVLTSCGVVLQTNQLAIVKDERSLPPDRVGEIWIQGGSLAMGYFNCGDEGFNRHLGHEGGWFATGDLGFLHNDHLFVCGRLKDMLIVNGRNFAAYDVERKIQADVCSLRPGCLAVFPLSGLSGVGFAGELKDEYVSWVGRFLQSEQNDEALRRIARDVAVSVRAGFGVDVQKVWLLWPRTIPKTSSGKIRRAVAAKMLETGDSAIIPRLMVDLPLADVGETAEVAEFPVDAAVSYSLLSPTSTERMWLGRPSDEGLASRVTALENAAVDVLIQCLSRVSTTNISLPEDDAPLYTSLALSSIEAVQLVAELENALDVAIPQTFLFEHPTMGEVRRQLALMLARQAVIRGEGGEDVLAALEEAAVVAVPKELADKSICRFAVVAVDLRLPGNVRSLSDMQRIFVNRLDPVTECPMGWDSSHYDPCGDFYTREGGFVDIEFNPSLVPPAEAFTLDPQQKRLLLSCHRLMARVPDAGSRVGVFVASSSNEWTAVMPRTESAFMATATSPSLMSNRVSFSLGLTGPSMTIDTACSSSLVAMDAALRSLRASQCDMAIIGASNSLMDSQVSRVLCKAGMLASHGRCRAFDSSAEGYVRSEACVTLAVVPLSSHIVRASQVLAIVESSHVNHGGTAAGLTVPSSQQQAACIRSAASAVPQVDYLETHGTGTALGDPLEVAGISQAFERRELPLVLGAAKSYFGHAEGAAGLVGVCAAVVALNTGYVPSPLHYERLNSQVRLPTWAQLGTEGANIRSAGVSSFGFGGTNAHVVLSAPSLPADLSEPPSAVVSTREKRAVGHPLLGALTPLLGRAYYLRLDVAQLLSHLCLRDQAVLGWGFLLDVLFSFVRPADRIANVRFADLAPIPDSLTFASNAFVPTNVPCPALTFEQLQQRRRDCVGLVTSEETVQGARTLQVMGFTTGHPSRRPLCVASVRQAPVSLAPAPPLEVDALNSLAPDALYAKLAARGIHLKAGYRRIASCFLSTDVIICELRTLELFEGDDHFALDPVSIDLALVSCLMLVNGAATSITSVRLETTRLLSTFRCERLSDMKCRVDLYDEDDRAVVSLGEVAFRPLTPPKAPMYRLSFKPTQVSSFKIPPDFLFAKLCQAGLVGSDESPLTLGVEDKVIVVVSPDANLSALDGILVSKMVVVSNSPLLWHPPTSAVGLVVCPLGSSIPSPDLVVGRVWRLQNGMWEVQTREPVLGRRIQFQSLPPDYVRVASLTGGGAVVTESNSDVEVGTVVDASPLTSVMQALPAETCTPLDRPQQHSADTLLIAGLPPDVSDVMLEFAVMMGWRHVRLLDAEPHGRCSRSLSSAFDIQQADSAKGTFMLCYCSLSFYLKWLPAPSVVLHPVGTALHCPLPHPVSLLQYNPGVHRHDLLNALSLLKTGVHTMSPLQPSTASITHSHKLSASRPLREQISEILLAAAVTVSGREDLEPNEVFGDAVDSLATMEFRERVSESIGIEVPMSALFDHPTLELLTSYLETIVCPAPQTAPVPTRASPVDPPCIAAFSLRLPGGVFDAESFWNMLTSPSDCRSLVPLSRFNVDSVYNADRAASGSSYVRHAAFAPYMDRFCPEHFGVNSLELQAMDPQHRVALTLALSCLASNRRLSASGFPTTDELYCNEDVLALRETFMDQDIGVFIGSCNPDWHYMPNNHDTRMSSAYSCVGGSQGLIANRVSHTFGLRGPSQTVDAACASSLVALADACDSIAAGRCSGALVGGVNLLLAPQVFVGFSRTQVLSPDGACKSFSADADGYGRGEGASMMLILPLSRAAALGYRPLGLVSGWAVTHSGRSTSMTAPSAKGQERAMRGALSMAGIDPADVGVIETHGTGTVLGDAIEAEAIAAVYGDRDSPITLASLKSRVGHGEGNAGAAGVLKAAMMLDQVSITPNANFSEWNPNLPKGVEWRVPLETTPLVSEHIGVSAFGFGGVNAHVIISKAPKTDVNSSASSPVRTQQEAICPQVLLVFAGQGSQHPGMLHDAYGSCGPRLASLIRHAQTIIGKDAMEAIWSSSTDAKDPLLQMGLLLVQLAQAETIMAEEIPVAAVVGHSLGELTLAAFVGAITADEAIRLLWSRIRLLHSTAEGRMVVLRRTLSEVKSAIDAAGVGVSIGAVNSATSVVLSGSSEEVDLVVKALHNDSPLLYKDLNVSHAFHSDLMEPVKEQFAAACREILEETNITSNILTISTVTGTRVDPTVFRTAAHWTNQLTSTVLFKDAVDTAARLLTGRPILPVELGIRPILTSLLRELLPLTKPVAFSGRQALDKLTLALTPSVKGVHDLLDPRHQPRHPWTPQDHPMYQTGLAPLYLRDDQVKVLMDHRVQFEALLPASQWVDLAVSLTRHLGYRGLQRVVILRPTKLQLPRPGREPPMQLRFQLREDVLEVSCRETESKREDVVMSARMSSSPVDSFAETLAAVRRRLEPLDLHMEAFYTELAEAGLQYGPHFRCLSSVLANQERTEFLSLIEAPSCAVSWTESDWLTGVAVDPRMLDASLHPLALMNLLSKMDMQNGQALLPAEFRGVVAFAPLPLRLLSHVTLLEVERPKPVQTVEPPRSVSVKLDLRSEEGQLLLRIERLSLRRVDMKPKVTPITRMLWSEELQSFSPAVECVEGVYSVGVYPTCDFRPFQSPEELQAATCLLYRVENVSDVLKLVGLLKALRDLNLSSSLVIWVVEEFGGGIGRGFVRSARLELQRLLPHVILKHYEGPDQGLHLVLASPEADVVFRDNTYFGRRLHQIPAEILHPKSLVLGDRGSINSLEPRPQAVAARRKPTGTAVEVRVMAVGLNFRDVLNVLGLYPGQPGPPGADFAGVVTRTGEAAGVEVGEKVYGLAPGCLQPFTITDSRCIRSMPPSLDFQRACCLPIAAVTVEYAFADLAKVQMGDTVLVHAVTGAVGVMALQYCQRVGAVCIGTAGSEYKRSKALELGVAFVSSSRDADTFIKGTRQWLESEDRDGVDVVLNSLIGEFIPYSLSLLKSGGRFVELGKRENWSADAIERQFPNVKHHVVAVDTLSDDNPEWMGSMLDRVSEEVGKRNIIPLPMHVTSIYSESHGLDAFRHLQRAQHIGKVVITFDSPFSGGTVLVSGGFGALGGVLVRWAADEGVRHFILIGRSSRHPSFDHLKVHCVKADVANFEQFQRALEARPADFPPVTSIFHLAGVLDDRPLFDITSESLEFTMQPKVMGFQNLDRLSRSWPVKNFVVFSSVAAVLGNTSQVNYGISNAVMEELAAGRRADGLSCAVVQWGPWTDQGMATAFAPLLDSTGLLGIDNERALRCLQHILQYRSSQTTLVQPIGWTNFCSSRRYDQINMPTFLANEVAEGLKADQTQVIHVAVDDSLLQMTPEERGVFVADLVRNTAAKIVGCPAESLSMSVPVVESGIDSLGAVEFGSILSKVLGVSMGPTILFDYPTLADITSYLQGELECLASSASKSTTPTKTRESSGTSRSSDHDNTTRYAIVGMSCRMPKDVADPDTFWKTLLQGKDCVGPVPDARFNLDAIYDADPAAPNCTYATEAGFMKEIDLFDRGFFRLSEEEVSLMDPQQRMLLEMLVDCGTDAGLITDADTLSSANTLKGSNWGVFVGLCNADWLYTSAVDQCNSTFSSTGAAHCMASNRISYLLGLKGPSMTIDTACSSSLVALNVALSTMNADPSIEGCFVGGVNLMLTPHPFVSFAKTRMLSPDKWVVEEFPMQSVQSF